MIARFRDFQVNRILTGALMLIAFCGLSFSAAGPEGQDQKITKANYDLAARFAPEKVAKMVFDTSVEPRWLEKSDRFWYSYKTSVGRTFYLVEEKTVLSTPSTRTRSWPKTSRAGSFSSPETSTTMSTPPAPFVSLMP
jgi:hypothetical protein